MELKLVYRGLRQVSDWALRFYSDISVDGAENVPKDGPLIMCVRAYATVALSFLHLHLYTLLSPSFSGL